MHLRQCKNVRLALAVALITSIFSDGYDEKFITWWLLGFKMQRHHIMSIAIYTALQQFFCVALPKVPKNIFNLFYTHVYVYCMFLNSEERKKQ